MLLHDLTQVIQAWPLLRDSKQIKEFIKQLICKHPEIKVVNRNVRVNNLIAGIPQNLSVIFLEITG